VRVDRMDALLEYIQASPLAIWGLFGLLILCGVGLPMPEDIVLIAAGLVAAETGQSWVAVSVLMYFGVVAGDSLIFAVGRYFGRRLLALPWTRRWLNSKKQERIAALFDRRGSAAFFIARFMPGLRAPIFCTAGAMKVRYLQFLLYDGLAALVSVPLFVWLGHFLWQKFGDDFEQMRAALSRAHAYTMIFALVVLGVVIALLIANRRRLARALR
jgi:membrane protein DedA with SNARE-associated domain